jgi:para-nitrobenzyl esterase
MIDRRTVLGVPVACVAAAAAPEGPDAVTRYGKVRGTETEGIKVFKGIPYAHAERFRGPTPPVPWNDIREASAFGPMSPQAVRPLGSLFASWTFDKEMSEDCQVLNVWTPALRDGRKRPVMMWLHGGDFSSLSGSRNVFNGTRLARKGDVVVVTLNHRLNVFGYLQLAQLAPAYPSSSRRPTTRRSFLT